MLKRENEMLRRRVRELESAVTKLQGPELVSTHQEGIETASTPTKVPKEPSSADTSERA